jgi:hypothetical protein
MRDGLAVVDRVQLHINNGKKKAYTRNGLDWIKRFYVGRSAAFLSGPGESVSGTFETCPPILRMSGQTTRMSHSRLSVLRCAPIRCGVDLANAPRQFAS